MDPKNANANTNPKTYYATPAARPRRATVPAPQKPKGDLERREIRKIIDGVRSSHRTCRELLDAFNDSLNTERTDPMLVDDADE
jgi:hypothetical protein